MREKGSVVIYVLGAVVLIAVTVATTTFYLGKGQDALFGFFNGTKNIELSTSDSAKEQTQAEKDAVYQKLNEAMKPSPTASPSTTIIPLQIQTINITGLSARDKGALIEWSGESANGFKVCFAETANPSYPGSNCTLKGSGEHKFEVGGLTPGKTYHFRVGAYGADGKVTVYSGDAKVVPTGSVSTPVTSSNSGLSLAASSNEPGKVSMSWTLNGDPKNGFKEVWADHANPTYPEDHWNYDSNTSLRNYTFSDLPSGQTLHFRVGIYENGKVSTYSNDVTVTVK